MTEVRFSAPPSDKAEMYAIGTAQKRIYARIWRGRTKPEMFDEYSKYLYESGVLKIERIPGNLGVQMFRSRGEDFAVYMVISYWPSLDSIKAFSGEDVTRTRHLERDPDYLLELPERVTLYEVCANDWKPF